MPSTFLVRYFLLTKIYSLYHTHSHSGFPTMLECRYLSVHPSETQRSGERATQPDHEDSAFLSNRMAHTHQQQSVHTHTHTHTHNSSSFLSFRAFQFLSRNNTVACLVGTADTQRYRPTYQPTYLPISPCPCDCWPNAGPRLPERRSPLRYGHLLHSFPLCSGHPPHPSKPSVRLRPKRYVLAIATRASVCVHIHM